MSDIKKPSNLPDESSENQDLPAKAEQDPGKGKRKSGQVRKNALLSSNKDQGLEEQATPQIEEQVSTDDLLADIRRSLVEEDVSKREKKQKGIFQRVARIIKPGKAPSTTDEPKPDASTPVETDVAPAVEEAQELIETPAVLSLGDENASVAEADKISRPESESESVENTPAEQDALEFILGLEAGELIPEKPQGELLPQPEPDESSIAEKTGDSEGLQVQPEREKRAERYENIREVALEDYGESQLQPEGVPSVSWEQKFKAFFKGLKPLERALIFGTVGLIFIVGMIGFGFRIITALIPEAPPVPTQELPIPVRVTLPGGWEFSLTKGKVENGSWSPRGPEWLEGTELCKWVGLPWSLQLEAVVRTLKQNDPIELNMSNADQLQYKVRSINNVPVAQIGILETKTACLLLILVNEDADTRWVVTAIP